jgi:hypothetical protein
MATITTLQEARRWALSVARFHLAYGRLGIFITAGRQGDASFDPWRSNALAYWRPGEIRSAWLRACQIEVLDEADGLHLLQIGREARMAMYIDMFRLMGVTEAGRKNTHIDDLEATPQSDVNRRWLVACIENDREALSRLGVVVDEVIQ